MMTQLWISLHHIKYPQTGDQEDSIWDILLFTEGSLSLPHVIEICSTYGPLTSYEQVIDLLGGGGARWLGAFKVLHMVLSKANKQPFICKTLCSALLTDRLRARKGKPHEWGLPILLQGQWNTETYCRWQKPDWVAKEMSEIYVPNYGFFAL